MKKDKLRFNVILNTFYQVLIIIIPLITEPYLSRVLGRDNIGVISYTGSIQIYFALFAALGTVSYGTRIISQKRNDKKAYSKCFLEIELLTVATTVICLVGWLVLICITKKYQLIFLILSVNVVAVLFDVSWLYAGLEKYIYTISVNIVFKMLQLLLIFLFVNDENGVFIYLVIITVTNACGNIAMWLFLPKTISKTKLKEIRPLTHLKEIWIYFVPTIATTIYTTLDKTLIGVITKSEAENGYYEQATKIIHVAEAVTFNAVNTVLFSRNAYLFSEKKFDEIKEKISDTMDYIFFMSIGIAFGIIGIADRFVPLFFGEGYDKVALLLKCFAPIVFIIGISNCLGGQYYTPAGKRAQSARFIVIGAITNALLNIALIPVLKSTGAVIASVIAEFIISFLYLRYCDGYFTARNLLLKSYKKLISGVVMLAVIAFVDSKITNDYVAVATEIIMGLFVYVILVFILKDSIISVVKKMMKKRGD